MDTPIATITSQPAIAMDAVESSQIKAIGFDAANHTLAVEFFVRRKGAPPDATSLYHYTTVPAEEHAGFMAAESKGKYLDEHIKGKYPYTRIR